MDKTEKLTLRECLLGDRAFYRHVLLVVLPIIVQNTLTNVVSLLDNVMVGQVGTLPMSGVAVVGQLLFVYNLAIWGSTSGAGIFGAQFYGRGDMDGVRHTFRFKLLVSPPSQRQPLCCFWLRASADWSVYFSRYLPRRCRRHAGLCVGVSAHHACGTGALRLDPVLRRHPARERPDRAAYESQYAGDGRELYL